MFAQTSYALKLTGLFSFLEKYYKMFCEIKYISGSVNGNVLRLSITVNKIESSKAQTK